MTGDLHPRTAELIEQVAQRVEQRGIDAWFDLDPAEDCWASEGARLRQGDRHPRRVVRLRRDPRRVLERAPELALPADLYLEGSDQHRGWFQSSLLTSVAMHGHAPYRAVLTHGFTVDAEGKKMSKSDGNVVAPQKVMKQLGADVLRLWVAATDYRGEMSISDEILEPHRRCLPAHPQHRPLPARPTSRLRPGRAQRRRRGDMLELDRWAAAPRRTASAGGA